MSIAFLKIYIGLLSHLYLASLAERHNSLCTRIVRQRVIKPFYFDCSSDIKQSFSAEIDNSNKLQPVYGFSSTLTQATSAIDIHFTQDKGRHLVVGSDDFSLMFAFLA
jgi:hypothetical protein